MTQTEPTTYDVLRWAYAQMDRDTTPPSPLRGLLKGGKATADDALTPVEARVEAARLRKRAVVHLSPLHQCAVNARFLPAGTRRERLLAAQQGERYDPRARERQPAIDGLAHWLMRACPVNSPRIEAYREVVIQWALREERINRLARAMKSRKEAAKTFRSIAVARLEDVLQEALDAASAGLDG